MAIINAMQQRYRIKSVFGRQSRIEFIEKYLRTNWYILKKVGVY